MFSKSLILLSSVLLALPFGLSAQVSPDPAPWSAGGTFEPYSGTAEAITGPVTLTTPSLTLGDGKVVGLRSLGQVMGIWDESGTGAPSLAEVFQLDQDPGPLLNGNLLCGQPDAARYLVAYAPATAGEEPVLGLALFSGDAPPSGMAGPDLCGTFYYAAP